MYKWLFKIKSDLVIFGEIGNFCSDNHYRCRSIKPSLWMFQK